MKNTKTTIAGIFVIAAGILSAAAQFLQGHSVDVGLLGGIVTAVTAGLGLIHASDGEA